MDFFTLIFLGAIIFIGFTRDIFWLGLVGVLLFFSYVYGIRQEEVPAAPQGAGLPKIRPIIVNRRYSGPSSIYPQQMKIRVHPRWDTRKWWELALRSAGNIMSMMMFRRFLGKKNW